MVGQRYRVERGVEHAGLLRRVRCLLEQYVAREQYVRSVSDPTAAAPPA